MDNYKYGPFFSSCLMNMMMRVDLIMVSNFSQANSVFDRTQVQTTSEDIRHIQTKRSGFQYAIKIKSRSKPLPSDTLQPVPARSELEI